MNIKLIFILVLFFPLFTFGNMAKPYTDGAGHSVIFSNKSAKVLNETIDISILNQNEEDKSLSGFKAKYKIVYTIYSEENAAIPLLFIGIGLSNFQSILVNNSAVKNDSLSKNEILAKKYSFIELYQDNYCYIKYNKDDKTFVPLSSLIYFHANIQKGENQIIIEYEGELEVNRYGFESNYKLEYSLYPSQFWKSFGPISIYLHLPKDYELKESNFDEVYNEKEAVKWKITDINQEKFSISFAKKQNLCIQFLLELHPFGIACLSLLFFSVLNFYCIKKHRVETVNKYNYYLPIGIFVVPILFYTIFIFSYDFIDFMMKKESKHGYYFLFVFTYPIFLLIYALIFWTIDIHFKKKYK